MTELSQEALLAQAGLTRKYLESLPGKKAGIQASWKEVQSSDWDKGALAELRILVHRLAGSAGSYGLENLGVAASSLDESLKPGTVTPALRQSIRQQLNELLEALEHPG